MNDEKFQRLYQVYCVLGARHQLLLDFAKAITIGAYASRSRSGPHPKEIFNDAEQLLAEYERRTAAEAKAMTDAVK